VPSSRVETSEGLSAERLDFLPRNMPISKFVVIEDK
jgi:hypothetical protein